MAMADFFILSASVPEEYSKWLKLYNSWVNRDPFAHPLYCSLFVNDSTEAKCAVLSSDYGKVLYPFLLRNISSEEYAINIVPELYDLMSPYGYGGAYIISVTDKVKLYELFTGKFEEWATNERVVSEVIKFHLFDEDILAYSGQKDNTMDNIVVDLLQDADVIWTQFDYKVRKNVNKAKRSGLTFLTDTSGKYLDSFLNIYYSTLDRRSAKENYYFNTDFFRKIIDKMHDYFVFFHVLKEDKIISSELCLTSNRYIYSYLGGTSADYFDLRPNDFLKHHIILWGKENNKTKFVIGGGNQKDDTLFKYKKSFAPNGVYKFYVGTRIYDPNLYKLLIESKHEVLLKNHGIEWTPKEGFVPEYRT